jgi:hypothetical protein
MPNKGNDGVNTPDERERRSSRLEERLWVNLDISSGRLEFGLFDKGRIRYA